MHRHLQRLLPQLGPCMGNPRLTSVCFDLFRVMIVAVFCAIYISVRFAITTTSRLDLDTRCRLLVYPQRLTNSPKSDLAASHALGFNRCVSRYGYVILVVADVVPLSGTLYRFSFESWR